MNDMKTSTSASHGPGPRRLPVQERSRLRMQRMMDAAREIIVEQGADALRMNDVAVRADVSIGSLYQYFPDKTSLVATLAQSFYERGRQCVVEALEGVATPADIPAAMRYLARAYYRLFREDPAMLDVWSGMQADKVLRDLDIQENTEIGLLIAHAVRRVLPTLDEAEAGRRGLLVSGMIASAVMLAVSMPDEQGQDVMTSFEWLLDRALRP